MRLMHWINNSNRASCHENPIPISQQLNLLFIDMVKADVESNRRCHQDTRQHRIEDHKVGVLRQGCKCHGEQGSKARHRETDGLDDGSHALRRLVVRMFRAGRQAEYFCHATDAIDWYLEKHADLIRYPSSLGGGAFERGIVARAGVVDQLLQSRRVGQCGGEHGETQGNACAGAESDLFPPEPGVHDFLHQGIKHDPGQRVCGFDGVVRYTRVDHLPGLGDEVVEGLVEAEPMEWEEEKDAAGEKAEFELFDEAVVPGNDEFMIGLLGFRLGGIHAETAFRRQPEGMGGFCYESARWRVADYGDISWSKDCYLHF